MVPKKILYVEQNTDGTIGGSYFSLLFLVEGLDKSRYSPVAAFYQENQLIPRYRNAGCKILLIKKRRTVDLLQAFPVLKNISKNKSKSIIIKTILILQKIINYFINFIFPSFRCWYILLKEKIDLVHLNNTLLRPQEWILASLFTKTKVVAHERGINNKFPFQTFFWAKYLKAIICISDAVRINLLKYGFSEKKLFRIYNGLDPERFIAVKSREETLKEIGINENSPAVGIVGNIKYWKGQKIVVKAMEQVLKEFPNAKCILVGGVSDFDKEYINEIKEIIREDCLDGSIIFTGQRNDVPDLINSLSVLIHASILPEPFGRVLLEGMALKKPVITTNMGAGPEIVEDGKTGLIVPPEDEKSLAEAILSILRDPDKALTMGIEGRKRLEKYFHVSENIRKTEELYRGII
jgi:glycosyltransferase involved in cell wall biosynthesis